MSSLRAAFNRFWAGKDAFTVALGSSSGVLGLIGLYILLTRFKGSAARHRQSSSSTSSAHPQSRRRAELRDATLARAMRMARQLPGAQRMIDDQFDKVRVSLVKSLHKYGEQEQFIALPATGLGPDQVMKLLETMQAGEVDTWRSGKVSGGVYTATQAHIDFMVKVYAMFYVSNPLHPDVWPSVRRMEAEVVRMTASLFHGGPSVCGTMTSGGTESILNALKTYREWARATKPHVGTPEILAPTTAHAAFLKGCHLMNMKYVMVEVDEDTQQVNVGAMRRAITSNTIALVGSACTFPHGVVDNIPALASLAREHGLGLHVDCCLGGYVLPFLKKLGRPMPDFDFALDGVTSISCDTHKYGLTPKGTSVLLFSSPELRRHMYFKCTDWPGGLYASPTIPGSRPGALVAASWAALLSIGFDGYVKIATEIATAMDKLQAALAKLPGCKIFGPPHGPCVAWTSTAYNIYRMGELMSNRGYHLNSLHRPASIHIAFTDANCHTVDQLIADLQIVDAQLRSDPEAGNSGFAPLYGVAAAMPDRGVVADFLGMFLDTMLSDHGKCADVPVLSDRPSA